MDNQERSELLERIAAVIGDDAFNRLIDSVKEVRPFRRLRFWQKDLLGRANLLNPTFAEFLELFEGAQWRKTGRSRDALAAATKSFLEPVLQEQGFSKYSKRSYGRLRNNCVFQCIDLQLSAYGSKEFAVNYSSMVITRLHDFAGSSTLRRLPRGKSIDGWWRAKSHQFADESMQDVCERVRVIAMPWFDATSTVLGLAHELVAGSTADENPHKFFELGCCYATAGELERAEEVLRKAIDGFQKAYDEFPERGWALAERARAEELVSAIASRRHASLLSQWRDQTIVNLNLHRIGS